MEQGTNIQTHRQMSSTRPRKNRNGKDLSKSLQSGVQRIGDIWADSYVFELVAWDGSAFEGPPDEGQKDIR
jgi:hypothetical protein